MLHGARWNPCGVLISTFHLFFCTLFGRRRKRRTARRLTILSLWHPRYATEKKRKKRPVHATLSRLVDVWLFVNCKSEFVNSNDNLTWELKIFRLPSSWTSFIKRFNNNLQHLCHFLTLERESGERERKQFLMAFRIKGSVAFKGHNHFFFFFFFFFCQRANNRKIMHDCKRRHSRRREKTRKAWVRYVMNRTDPSLSRFRSAEAISKNATV